MTRRRGAWRSRTPTSPSSIPRGAILRVEACGICGTDARTFFNGDPKAPAPWQLGHEPVGVLDEVGPRGRSAAGRGEGRPRLPRVDPHVRRVPLVHRRVPEPVRAPPAVRLRPVPRGLRRVAAVPPIATKNLIPLPPELASRPRDRGRPVRLRAERHRAARRPTRRHRRDPRHGPDRVLAGRDGARPRRARGCT